MSDELGWVVEKLESDLRSLAGRISKRIDVLYDLMVVRDKNFYPFLERALASMESFGRVTSFHRASLAALAFITTWIRARSIVADETMDKPERRRDKLVLGKGYYLGKLRRVIEYLRGFSALELSDESIWKAVGESAIIVSYLADYVRQRRESFVYMLDPVIAAAFNPISEQIVRAVAEWIGGSNIEGARIGVFGMIGAGKTTLSYYSIVCALTALGLPMVKAFEYARHLIMNDPLRVLKMMELVTERKAFVPAMVVDDAALLLTKYWQYMPEYRRLVVLVSQAMKVCREGFGAVIIVSDVYESVAKGVRESLDINFVARVSKFRSNTYTIWMRFESMPTLAKPGLKPAKIVFEKRLEGTVATVHPPMYVPPRLYDELEEQKRRMRLMRIQQAKKIAEKIKEEEGGEEAAEEIEVGAEEEEEDLEE